MLTKNKFSKMILTISFLLLSAGTAFGHCDSMEGPVVKASQKALETGNVNYVLIWVKAEDEGEIKAMFDKVNKVRMLSQEVKDLADMYFFETVVRVHRMGEGVGYTGLKPTGYEPDEGIEAADLAIDESSIENILSQIEAKYHPEVKELFDDLQSKKNYDVNDLTAGREYVESYVLFIHYIEGIYNGEENNDDNHLHNH